MSVYYEKELYTYINDRNRVFLKGSYWLESVHSAAYQICKEGGGFGRFWILPLCCCSSLYERIPRFYFCIMRVILEASLYLVRCHRLTHNVMFSFVKLYPVASFWFYFLEFDKESISDGRRGENIWYRCFFFNF